MMNYLLADMFRCCVDFNGFFQRVDYPKSAAPEEALDIAASFAHRVVETPGLPRFLERQALLLLATLEKPVIISGKNVNKTIQHSLHAVLAGGALTYQRQRLALFEVASQITGKPDLFALYLLQTIESKDEDVKYSALEDIAKRGGEFWLSVWRRLAKSKSSKDLVDRLKWASPVFATDLKSDKQKLSKIVASDSNGFEHEVALIKLARALIDLAEKKFELLPLSPNDLEIRKGSPQTGWNELWLPEINALKCDTSAENKTTDPRFEIPPWLDHTNPDHIVVYWVGTILRSAVVGGSDYTGNRWKSGKVVSYKGLRTGWYKRRMGMMHSAEALVGNYATVTNWISELLMKCLQWPGFESTFLQCEDIAAIDDLTSLKKALRDREALLNAHYCSASRMPALVTTIRRPISSSRSAFRIVTVQQLLPRTCDFTISDPKLDLPKARAEGRSHIARVCQLTYKTLAAKLEADKDQSRTGADLIVFPEVAVHPEDQDLIKRLADKTKSIILAGLVFLDHKGKLVNVARWFIPDYRSSGRQWIIRDQGKANMTKGEKGLGITGYRPCQHIIELTGSEEGPIRIGGAICYDATDLNLAADLKKKTDLFVVCAHNKDVNTFDTMASALNYHMYQHVVVVNKGEFGGSTVQAPYKEHYDRLVSHVHGADQISIHVADIDPAAFRRKHKSFKAVKTRPAG
jgi:predicted amidohydrolase